MNERRVKLIADLIKHLEDMDGEEMKGMLEPKVEEKMEVVEEPMAEEPKDKGPMEVLAEKGTDAPSMEEDEELSDEEFEEMLNMSK